MKIKELDDRIKELSLSFKLDKEEVWKDFLRYKIELCMVKYNKLHYDVMDEYILNDLQEKYWRNVK